MVKQFKFLSHLRGPFAWKEESETLFDQFKDSIDERIRACDILDDRTRCRLTTACAWVLKIAMIFQAARLCYDAKWMPRDPQIVPDSPELILNVEALGLAIEHVEACLKAASSPTGFFCPNCGADIQRVMTEGGSTVLTCHCLIALLHKEDHNFDLDWPYGSNGLPKLGVPNKNSSGAKPIKLRSH